MMVIMININLVIESMTNLNLDRIIKADMELKTKNLIDTRRKSKNRKRIRKRNRNSATWKHKRRRLR